MTRPLFLDRRTFLRLAGAGVAATGVGACATGSTDEVDDTDVVPPTPRTADPDVAWPGIATPAGTAFAMGVASGDPLADTLMLWTRYTGAGTLSLSLSVWDGSAWGPTETYAPTVADGGYVHLDLDSLPDDAIVAFQFTDDAGAASVVGTGRTAPSADHDGEVRLGFGSCFDQDHLAFPSLTHLLARGPLDAFVYLGDTAYFDAYEGQEAFRGLWASNLAAPGLSEMRTGAPGIFMFDDHEFENDFDGETVDPALFRLGMDSFLEALPVRTDPAHPDRVYRRFRYGRTVELFCTDTRSERAPSAGEMMSDAQVTWLVEGLKASTATWKVVATAVPYVSFTGTPWDVGPLVSDKWAGFVATRTRILDAITEAGVEGVIFVSGDVHCGFVARVEPEGPAAKFFDVCCGPGGAFLNPTVASLPDGERFYWGQAVHHSTRFVFASNGTVTVEVVGEADETWARLVLNTQGEVVSLEALDESSLSSVF